MQQIYRVVKEIAPLLKRDIHELMKLATHVLLANQVVQKYFYKSYYITCALYSFILNYSIASRNPRDFQLKMDCLSTCALVFFCIATTQTGESVASEQTIFRRREQEYLADHVIETKQAGSELECGLHCLADTSCTSVNYKTSGIGKGRCELNDKTVEETPEVDDKIHHPEFNHLAVVERVSKTLNWIYLSCKLCHKTCKTHRL